MKLTYRATRYACYTGYVTQAIINNLLPLLFFVLQQQFGLSYQRLGGLILLNFATQLCVDILAVQIVDRTGYRIPMIAAHLTAVLGLLLLAVLPGLLPDPYVGLCIAVIVYALGGGLLEVLVSPIIDSLPASQDQRAAIMSLLHSFYCWGQVAVVLCTTLLLLLIGTQHWRLLPLIWAAVPLVNTYFFAKVPLKPTLSGNERQRLGSLLRTPLFFALLVLMVCAGAAELTISQWSSLFAEEGLGLDKVWGDLLGPFLFAVWMGIGRTFYGFWGGKIRLERFMALLGGLCVACYLVTCFAPHPLVGLLACGLCGFSVSLFWPGTYSMAAARFPLGGTAMFGALAVAGDLGASAGPWLAGIFADRAGTGAGILAQVSQRLFPGDSGLKTGILFGALFPLVLLLTLFLARKRRDAA